MILSKELVQNLWAIIRGTRDLFKSLWDQSDIEIFGNPLIQQGVRFNMFQLLQSVGKDGLTNISAKGLSGEGYEGHYFWDTEIYVLPVFQMMQPQIANQLLMYRHSILDAARDRARELGHKKVLSFHGVL